MEEELKQSESITQEIASAGEEFVEQTKNFWRIDEISKYFTWGNLFKIIISIISIIIFYFVYRLIKRLVSKTANAKLGKHSSLILTKAVSYVFYVLICMYVLSLFGVNLKAIWGAAGVAGLAIGFAAQTSVSNLISGLFVLGERTMKIGDFIQVGDVSGTIDIIGLLSVKIHTLDNQLIRIPNSSIISSNLVNFSHYSTRRFVFEIPVSYNSDMDKALQAISKVPSQCSCILEEPAPSVYYDGFNSGLTIKLAVWFNSSDLITVKNQVYTNIINVCREDKIEIPYEHFDITIVENKNIAKNSKKTAKITK